MYGRVMEEMRTGGLKYVKVGTGGDPSHAAARRAYEKAGFVPIPVVNYFKSLTDAESAGWSKTNAG